MARGVRERLQAALICAALLLAWPAWADELLRWEGVRIVECFDGDTCRVELPGVTPPFNVRRIRLAGINTPEIRGKEREAGLRAWAALLELLKDAQRIDLVDFDYEGGGFGRDAARILADGVDVGAVLVQRGLAEISTRK